MKSHKMIGASLDIETIDLEISRWQYSAKLSGFPVENLQLAQWRDLVSGELIIKLRAAVASRKYDVKTVSFPKGPWQWIKFNLIDSRLYGLSVVRWFLKKYPVKTVEVTMEASAYYPEIVIPNKAAFVSIAVAAQEKYL